MFQKIFELFDFYIALNIAEAMLCFRLPKRSSFWKRYVACLLIQLIFPVLKYFLSDSIYAAFGFTAQYLITIPMILFCFKATIMEGLFCSSVALCIQHIAYGCYLELYMYLEVPMDYIYRALLQIAFYLIIYFIFYFCYLKVKIPKTIHFLENNYMMIWIVVVVTPVITWLCVAAMGFSSWSKEWCLLSYFFSMVISFIGMLAELEIYVTNMKTEENTALNLLIQHDRAEYQKIKNQIDMVNIRYHDLRHRYEALENFRSEESQSPYDLTFDTGDIALNYVLMEKNPIFTKKKIRITCFASELDIKHIKEEDKYSLFENAIMNAVNAVEKLDAEKRTISITAFKKGMFYHICVENYYEGTITIENGLPRTDKDGNGHGYGMKSMRSIATSYGGRVEISFEDEIFSLNILLPVTSKDRL